MLQVTNLSVIYGQKNILREINFAVGEQEILAVIGPSGAGKTTLINAITKLIPATGKVELDGKDVDLKQHTVAMVPQDYGLLPWETVQKNIVLVNQIRQHHALSAEQKELVEHLLAKLEITEIKDKFPNAISGGQAQRVALARAFSLRPDLLILDEPFSALDTVVKATAQKLFMQQWFERPVSTLLITHNLEEALNLSTNIFILADGTGYLKANPLRYLKFSERKSSPDYYDQLAALQEEVNQLWQK